MAEERNNPVKDLWETADPGHKRIFVVVVVLASIFLLIAFITGGDDFSAIKKEKQETVKRLILTGGNTRDVGVGALSADQKASKKDIRELRILLERTRKEVAEINKRRGNDPSVMDEMLKLDGRLSQLTEEAISLGWQLEDIRDGHVIPTQTKKTTKPASHLPVKTAGSQVETVTPIKTRKTFNENSVRNADLSEKELNNDPESYFNSIPTRYLQTQDSQPKPSAGVPAVSATVSDRIFTYTTTENNEIEEDSVLVELGAGAVHTGTLINGLDAPTGRNARKDPFPVLVRIDHEAILPNDNTIDLKGCFATLSGYGELSSERALLRGETISCITKSGRNLIGEFPSYAVGEDGKAGVRGHLVTRTGSLLAKTTLAGFAGAMSNAFNSTPVPVLSTGNIGGSKAFQQNMSKESVSHSAAKGTGTSLDRLAEYYMDMADEIFPVIEIDAGRVIDIITTQKIELKLTKFNRDQVTQG